MKLNFSKQKLPSGHNRMIVDYIPQITEQIEIQAIKRIIDEIAKDWIEQNGAELLKRITPEEVEKAVKQNLAKRVLNV